MPAPAVIPAPRAYIDAVAVKGFVVGARDFGWQELLREHTPALSHARFRRNRPPVEVPSGTDATPHGSCTGRPSHHCEQNSVSKAAFYG